MWNIINNYNFKNYEKNFFSNFFYKNKKIEKKKSLSINRKLIKTTKERNNILHKLKYI